MLKKLIAAAMATVITSSAYATDPIFVIRPPTGRSSGKVLPMNAFASTPSTPTTPSTPDQGNETSPTHVFKSPYFDQADFYGPPTEITISLNKQQSVSVLSPTQIPWCVVQVSPRSEGAGQIAGAGGFHYQGVNILRPNIVGIYYVLLFCQHRLSPDNDMSTLVRYKLTVIP
jgi:hypothetical protein